MSKKGNQAAPTKDSAPDQDTAMLFVFRLIPAWLVPGLGHFLLGRRQRAAVFALVIVAAFVTGVALEGELAVPNRSDPFSWLAAVACLGNGILFLATKLFGFGKGEPTAWGFAIGNTFLYTAGLMNLLAVIDVSDIARGLKD